MVTRKKKSNTLNYLGAFSLGVVFQMIFNVPNRPWSNDGQLYRGDRVVLTKKYAEDHGSFGLNFYFKCDYVHTDGTAAIVWYCPNHDVAAMRKDPLDVFETQYLELKR